MTSATEDSPTERDKWLWQQQENLEYQVLLSARYHAKRERFFALCDRMMQAFAALTATAAFASIAGAGTAGAWWALAAAIASIVPLVFGLNEASRRHGQLKASFKTLSARMAAAGVEWGETDYLAFKAEVAAIEAGEPAALQALAVDCHNEIAVATRRTIYPLRWWERALMHFISFDNSAIVARTPKAAQTSV